MKKQLSIVPDFFNKLATDVRLTYFPQVSYYRDNKKCAAATYAIELFNNGCLRLSDLINKLSSNCGASKEDITKMVNKYIIY